MLDEPDSRTTILSRAPWGSREQEVLAEPLRRYVADAIIDPLTTGRVALTGMPHATRGGGLVVDDVMGVMRVEHVDRELFVQVLHALVARDRDELGRVLEARLGGLDDGCERVVWRRSVGLRVEWSRLAFLLALREISRMLVERDAAGAAVFGMLTDELTRRADLAHEHPEHLVLQHSSELAALLDEVA